MTDSPSERLSRVRDRIEQACRKAGRPSDEVTLVAVSKTHSPEAVRALAGAGQFLFGENKVQEARAKIPQCPDGLTWHLVGHLQTNKVKHAVQLFDMIHSVDSLKLLESVEQACAALGRIMPICLEVNVAGEASKHGMAPDDLPKALERAADCPHLEVQGLMAVPPFREDPEEVRPYFRRLAELKEQCGSDWGFPLAGLSMGMSHDLEQAVEEGASWVRVGTDLFGKRDYA